MATKTSYVHRSIANILHTDSNYIDLHSGGLLILRTGVGSAVVIYLLYLKTSLNLDYLWYMY